jgi:hypothetical protein
MREGRPRCDPGYGVLEIGPIVGEKSQRRNEKGSTCEYLCLSKAYLQSATASDWSDASTIMCQVVSLVEAQDMFWNPRTV